MALKRSRNKINLGRKHKESVVTASGNEINYPSLYITNKKLPLEAKQIGTTLTAVVKLKFTGISERSGINSPDKKSYDFDVKEIQFN